MNPGTTDNRWHGVYPKWLFSCLTVAGIIDISPSVLVYCWMFSISVTLGQQVLLIKFLLLRVLELPHDVVVKHYAWKTRTDPSSNPC